MSKMGWGYNSNRRNQEQISIDRLKKAFENDELKVYESKNNLFKGGIVTIRVIINKIKNTKTILLTGENCYNKRVKPVRFDATRINYLKTIKEELPKLLHIFECNMYNIRIKEIEEMTDKEFLKELDIFYNHDINVLVEKELNEKWNRLYKDMFERTSLYNTDDIIIEHEKYLKAIKNIGQ